MRGDTNPNTGWTNTFQMLADEFAQMYGERPSASPEAPDVCATTTGPTPKTSPAHLKKLHLDFHAVYPRTAICLSGGGIRSAAFALGVLQFLATAKLLHRFQFISTVSGGGYIGSWLSGWIARLRSHGVRYPYLKVRERLSGRRLPEEEAPEIQGLRANSNYLTPKLGGFSADTWSALAIWLRNLIVIWFLLLPLLAAAAVFPQIVAAFAGAGKGSPAPVSLTLEIVGIVLYAFALINFNGARPRQQAFGMGQPDFLLYSLLPLLFSAALWAISMTHVSPIPGLWFSVVPDAVTARLPPQIVNYTILGLLIYGFALLTAVIVNRRNGNPYVSVGACRKEGSRLTYSFVLSTVTENGASVYVVPEDNQAVAGKHYYPIDPVKLDFPAGRRDSPNRLTVSLTGEHIGGQPVGSDDFFLKFSNPQNLRFGRVSRKDRAWDAIIFCLSGIFFGLLIACGDMVFRPWLNTPSPVDQQLSIFFSDFAGPGFFGDENPAPFDGVTSAWRHLAWCTLAVPWLLLSHALATVIFVALTSWLPRSDEEREWLGRAAGWYLVAAFAWAVVAALVLLLPLAASEFLSSHATDGWDWKKLAAALLAALGGGSGILTAFVGGSAKTAAVPGLRQSGWRRLALYVAAPVFLMSLFVGLALAVDWFAFGHTFATEIAGAGANDFLSIAAKLALFGIVPALFSATVGFWININRFSLHEMYRNRIVRAFLGASNTRSNQKDRFTFFNFTDNLPMSRLWIRTEEAPPGKDPGAAISRQRAREWRPFHVINIALNLVSTDKPAWQERKAESFTVTPLWCGSAQLDAFRRTSEYGGKNDALTLGTAMAISGAAVSPNMGYNSSPLTTFLLTLFNARLGWWLGNPLRKAFANEGPRFAALPLLLELFGLTNDKRKYVYLSDGGHFENLGLYEMVRRRCHLIIVSDASHDKELAFGNLSNAVRKIRIDLGISVEFEDLKSLRLRNTDRTDPAKGGPCYTIGRILYTQADKPPSKKRDAQVRDGIIIYLKPGFRGDEAADIVGYAASSTDFPHETTVDQWFSESQFESYRNLGYAIMKRAHDNELAEYKREHPGSKIKNFQNVDTNFYIETVLRTLKTRPRAAGQAAEQQGA